MDRLKQDIEEEQKYMAKRPQEHAKKRYDDIMDSCENNPARQQYVTAFQLYLSEHYRSAIGFLDEVLKLKPDFADAYDLRGEVWYRFLKIRLDDERGDQDADYKEYINSPAWKVKKMKVLERDGRLCVCGDEATDVHHKTYTNIGKEPLSDLVSLCKHCHDGYHKRHSEPLHWQDKLRVQ